MKADEPFHDYPCCDDAAAGPTTLDFTSTTGAVAVRLLRFIEASSTRICGAMAAYPTRTRVIVGAFFAMTLVFAFVHGARAQTPPPQAQGQSLLQSEIDIAWKFEDNWNIFDKSLALGASIFASLAVLSVIVAGVRYYIANQSIRGLGQLLLTRVLMLGIPFVIITLAPTLLPLFALIGLHIADLVTGDTHAASGAMNALNFGNNSSLPDPGTVQTALTTIFYKAWAGVDSNAQMVTTITPRSIVDEGVQIAWPLIQIFENYVRRNPQGAAGQNGTSFNGSEMEMGFVLFIAIGIISMFAFIAIELILAYLQIYLVLPVAAFSLGFLGSPATRQYGSGYWNMVAQSLLRFLALIFVIGFACVMAEQFAGDFALREQTIMAQSAAGRDAGILKLAITAFIVCGSLFVIVRALPGMFAAVLLGGAGGSADGFSSTEGQANAIGSRGFGGGRLPGGGFQPGLNASGSTNAVNGVNTRRGRNLA